MSLAWKKVVSWKEGRSISEFFQKIEKKKKSEDFQWPQELSLLAFLCRLNFDSCVCKESSHILLAVCISANSPTEKRQKEQGFALQYLFPQIFIKEQTFPRYN